MESFSGLLELFSITAFGIGLVSLVIPLRVFRITSKKQSVYLLFGSFWVFIIAAVMMPTQDVAPNDVESVAVPETPEEQLQLDLAQALGTSNRDIRRVSPVEVQGSHLIIQWAINNNITEGMTRSGARIATRDILQVLSDTSLLFDTAQLIGSFPFVDRLGNSTAMRVVNATYTSDLISQINFENFLFVNSYELAESAVIPPDFQWSLGADSHCIAGIRGERTMTGRRSRMRLSDRRTSRRQFFKLLAASPLLNLVYPALPPNWQRALARESQHRAAAGPRPAGVRCPDCGEEMVFPSSVQPQLNAVQTPAAVTPQSANALENQLTGQLLESPDQAINVWDFERVAHANNLPQHWDYLHLGVDDFETKKANREGFQRLMIRPRRLGVEATTELDMSVEFFGRRWDTPLFLCPVASLEAYHTQGESGAARAARARGILQMQSHQSSQSYDAIAEARGEPHWFQIYTRPDWNVNKRVIDRVKAAGCPALVWTIDLLGGSNRELMRRSLAGEGREALVCQNCHNHRPDYQRPMRAGLEGPPGPRPPYTWDYVKRLKDASDMKVILKGIVTAEEAELAVEHGADGIFVSNHGGRAENSLWSSIDSLPEVVAAVRGRVPVLIDSGVRRGTDIFKALALGADAVGIGRPYVWGLGAFGEDGVDKVIELMLDEFRIAMRQTRTTAIAQIGSQFVMEGKAPIMMRDNRLGFGL